MNDRRRLAPRIILVAVVLLLSVGFGWWIVGPIAPNVQREKQANYQAEQLKRQMRITDDLLSMNDSTARSLTTLTQDLGPAVQEKEKIGPERVKQLDENLAKFKKEIEQAKKRLEALEQDARSSLEGDYLKKTLADIKEERAYLDRLEGVHDQFRSDFEKAFGKGKNQGEKDKPD